MLAFIFKTIFNLRGWKVDRNLPEGYDRCVMIAAPHTSNWDLIYMVACFATMKVPYKFTIKKEWNKPIIGRMLQSMGAVWIDRTPKVKGEKKLSTTDAMANLFKDYPDKIAVVVTPEGTRTKREEWRTGFWHIANKAEIHIGLGYLDYKNKIGGIGKMVFPKNVEEDLREVMAFYKDIDGKDNSKFSVDLRYVD